MAAFPRHSGHVPQPERSLSSGRSPITKAATVGFTYAKQRSYPASLSASPPQAPSPMTYVTDGFSSLPRPKRNNGQPVLRRKAVNNALQGYFKSLNSMARSIVLETETVEKEHQCQWKRMDDARKEEVVNDHFIPQDIRMHYDFDFSMPDRSMSRGSFSSMPSSWGRPQSAHSMNDGMMFTAENDRPLRLSQPSDWSEEWPNHVDNQAHQLGHNREEIAYREQFTNHLGPGDNQTLSLSQPSNYSYEPQAPVFNRLHKKQLSFRPSRKQHAVHTNKSPSQVNPHMTRSHLPRNSLGSDGESPRTSDEDYEMRNRLHQQPENSLGFQRTRLRSYSMRSKRVTGNGRSNNSGSIRGSMRATRKKVTTPESNCKTHLNSSSSTNPASRPSHFHSYSNTSTDTDFDGEIDLPDPSLLLDHLQLSKDKSQTEDSRFHNRNARIRRSLKGTPKVVVNQASPQHSMSHLASKRTDDTTDMSSTDDLDIDDIDESILDEPIHRADSHESIDLDRLSITPSNFSHLQTDDDALSTTASEISRMTPDSMLSSTSFRPKTKQAEVAVLRNKRGKWGGSSYKHTTSNFADRHNQFRPIINRNQGGSTVTSASTTRASSPVGSAIGLPSHEPTHNIEDANGYLKPPAFAKYNSVSESVTSDLPHSPEHLSHFTSPPQTPHALANSAAYIFNEKRESGYISSSSESFQIGGRR